MSEGHKTSIKDIPSQAIHEKIETVHGIKYIIIGPIETPSGKTVTIFTVWIVDAGEDAHRFITARPYKNG